MVYALVGALLLALGVIFLAREGLERASWWAGLGAFLVTVVSAAVALTRARVRRTTADQVPPSPPAGGGDGHRRDEPIQHTGEVQQHNTGGINIANTGTVGEVDVRTDGGTIR